MLSSSNVDILLQIYKSLTTYSDMLSMMNIYGMHLCMNLFLGSNTLLHSFSEDLSELQKNKELSALVRRRLWLSSYV